MPPLGRRSRLLVGCVLMTLAGGVLSAAQPDTAFLNRMQAFAERYYRDNLSLVAEEHYEQNVTYTRGTPQHRVMASELVMVRLPGTAGWMMLRDVLEVDKRRLRQREQRLFKLLQSSENDAFARALELARESARFNLGRVPRTINVPDVAIAYLLPQHSGRMHFEGPRDATIDGAAVAMYRFRELRGPSIIRDVDGRELLAERRVWAEPASGEIVRVELIVRDRVSRGTNVVDFRVDPRLGFRVPVRMTERYTMRGETIDAVATYSNFRSFVISTSEKVGRPPG